VADLDVAASRVVGFNQDMFGEHPDVMDYSHQHYEDRKKKK
jgi:hypothetical protein